MYHLTDPTHAWALGGVRIVYIGSAAYEVLDIFNHFNVSQRVIQQGQYNQSQTVGKMLLQWLYKQVWNIYKILQPYFLDKKWTIITNNAVINTLIKIDQ